MNIKIRKATQADSSIIYHFICFLEEYSFDEKQFRENYAEGLEDDNNLFLIAELEGEVIGFLSACRLLALHRGGITYQIQELFITRAYREKGISKLLLEAFEEQLEGTAYQGLSVSIRPTNTEARKMYEKAGYNNTHIHLVKTK